MTERLYYTDSYLTRFDARILEARSAPAGWQVYLDRTAFYPASGGQPFDLGQINGQPVVDVIDEDDRIAHLAGGELGAGPAACEIDWVRRFDHMQQHSGQHLLSAVMVELFKISTVSFHLGAESSTIDVAAASVRPAQVEAIEDRVNALVFENRPIQVRFYSPEEAVSAGLRKPSERQGEVRVVEIAGCDRSACGGTHVRSTAEIGPIVLRGLDRVRQTARIEFLCGRRALRRTRADYRALAGIAQLFSAPLDQAPALVVSQLDTAKATAKALQKAETELADYKGRELYASTAGGEQGLRLCRRDERTGPVDPWRRLAQSFTDAGPGAVFLLTMEEPPLVLLACSPDLDLNAGALVKSAAEALGGRGGGSVRLAQATFPDAARAHQAAGRLLQQVQQGRAT